MDLLDLRRGPRPEEATNMGNRKSPLAILAYFIVGLIVLSVAAKVIWWLISLVVSLVTVAVSIAIVAGVGYVVYLLIREMFRSSQ